jgi:hypothetical protein
MKPMKWPDRVTVLHKLRDRPEVDTDHFILDVLILSELHRRPAGTDPTCDPLGFYTDCTLPTHSEHSLEG